MTDSKKADVKSDDEDLCFKNFVNSFIENYQEMDDALFPEAFELYVHRLKAHFHQDPEAFHSRFTEGYKAILTELIHH